ncbi:PH domain-containing protein [Oceanobacillus halophilus]|uniref:YdbS-like PH domain-containing protein n=1 Tax=Oceanobacillus halophilus TaxID=930130 RepID=A0A494ZW57_9BACI|nr:PH domain-containing protein [Oceanobacillus halophilus]RKQ30250.1 hypothetical protein D8M06_16295 [Oceanobacillus halophilus]
MENNVLHENREPIRKLHPLWMFAEFLKSIKGLFFFFIFLSVVLGFSSHSIFSIYGFIGICLFLCYQIVSILLEWKHFGYSIQDDELFIKKGRFLTIKRYFPINRIQSLNQSTPFFHRLFGLTSLLIDAGSSDKDSSIKLEMISIQDANDIKKQLSKLGNGTIDITEEDHTNEETALEDTKQKLKKHYEISVKEILVASLTSLRLLFFLTLVYSVYSEISHFFSIDQYVDQFIDIFLSSWFLTITGIVLLLVLSMLYGVLKTYIQYGGFTVASDSNHIYIAKGKINTTYSSIAKDRIQALTMNSSFVHKLLHIVQVKMISATDTEDEVIQASNVLFPFIHKYRARNLIAEVTQEFHIKNNMMRIPRSSILVKLLRTMILWLLIPVFLYYFYPGFWYIATIIFALTILSQIVSGLYSSYSINGSFMQIEKGALSTKFFITNRDKIERLIVTETAIQRKLGLASMKIISRAKPTKTTTIHDIPKEAANRYYEWYLEGTRGQVPRPPSCLAFIDKN